jgi:Ca-activated chloride channel family protein
MVKITLVGAIALTVAGTVALAQPTFSRRVEGVRVDVLVSENGRPLGGLTRDDFELFDNGVRQRIEAIRTGDAAIGLILAFDLSASVHGQQLDDLRAAANVLLAKLVAEDRVALITFNHAVALRSPLTADHTDVRAAMQTAEADGNTALVDGAFTAMTIAEAEVGRSLIVVFSDGVDTSSWLRPPAVLERARRLNAVVYAVSSGPPSPFLRELTDLTGGQLFNEPRSDRLTTRFGAILDEFRQRYLLTYTPQGVEHAGWHRLEVRVKHRRARVQARPGYLAGS